jgi:uncharacterized membrane protein YGL010W
MSGDTQAVIGPKPIVRELAKYAQYHRDRRNILTHFFGVPLIVFSVMVMLGRAHIGGVSLLWVGLAVTCAYYLYLELSLGLVMTMALAAMAWLAAPISVATFGVWLSCGIGIFTIGWVLQFIGHYFEGKKPAFVDDLIGLAIGPIFVGAELLFKLGLRHDLESQVTAIAGPVH